MADANFWGLDDSSRLHPRLAAEMLLDAIACDEQTGQLATRLRERGFEADMIRAKGYINKLTNQAVCVLPFASEDMQAVASLSIRRNLGDLDDQDVSASATTVEVSQAVNAQTCTLLAFEKGKLVEYPSFRFSELRDDGIRSVLKRLCRGQIPDKLERMTKGSGLSRVVLEDLAADELKVGFISPAEHQRIVGDAELYSEVARLHTYLAAAASSSGGCKNCCSTSCYACSSCSCGFGITTKVVA